ncbi:hypothetical protein GWC95_13415 [Sediminibacterium roseum]|uniref:Uncharacterized protein n=1 Tax=Sediminibacterium roseum TaxID=1978412 RepID=A0ABW9ZUV7_9BACT|nr:hypothetical protein [Sediminibacterium roseum]NCI50926.1 hypothetical protein [Sediminibacterium roseum]
MKKLLLVSALFFSFSCKDREDNQRKEAANWETIQIITRTQKIIIYNYLDTATFEQKIYKKDTTKFPGAYELKGVESKNFNLSRLERDSLRIYTYDIITNPHFTDKNASDYAGYVLIKLTDRNTTLMCEYKSVGEWSEVSDLTKKIYSLLKAKIPIASQ